MKNKMIPLLLCCVACCAQQSPAQVVLTSNMAINPTIGVVLAPWEPEPITAIRWVAQSFTPHTAVTIHSVDIDVQTDVANSSLELFLYSDNGSGRPGTQLFKFNGPTDPNGIVNYVVPGGSQALSGGTNYWVVARAAGSGQYAWRAKRSGWESTMVPIGDALVRSGNAGSSWSISSYDSVGRPRLTVYYLGPVLNQAPTAVAGPNVVAHIGEVVHLDGTNSFDDNTSPLNLVYSWKLDNNSNSLVNPSSPTPYFVAGYAGGAFNHLVVLEVHDEQGLISMPYYKLVSATNLAPTAVATSDYSLAIVGESIQLDGTGSSDPDGDPLTYLWVLTESPIGSVASIVDPTSAQPYFTPDLLGDYQFVLQVSDLIGPSEPVTLNITAVSGIDFAEQQIVAACDIIDSLSQAQVKTKGNQTALCNFLIQAVQAIHDDDVPLAISRVLHAMDRVDGCVANGVPDGNGPGMDWVIDCDAQTAIYDLMIVTLEALSP